jgi:hypothetical protein
MTTFRRSVDEVVPAVGLAPLDGRRELTTRLAAYG